MRSKHSSRLGRVGRRQVCEGRTYHPETPVRGLDTGMVFRFSDKMMRNLKSPLHDFRLRRSAFNQKPRGFPRGFLFVLTAALSYPRNRPAAGQMENAIVTGILRNCVGEFELFYLPPAVGLRRAAAVAYRAIFAVWPALPTPVFITHTLRATATPFSAFSSACCRRAASSSKSQAERRACRLFCKGIARAHVAADRSGCAGAGQRRRAPRRRRRFQSAPAAPA